MVMDIKTSLIRQSCRLIVETENDKENITISEWQHFLEKSTFFLNTLRMFRLTFLENELVSGEDLDMMENQLTQLQNFISSHLSVFVEN